MYNVFTYLSCAFCFLHVPEYALNRSNQSRHRIGMSVILDVLVDMCDTHKTLPGQSKNDVLCMMQRLF